MDENVVIVADTNENEDAPDFRNIIKIAILVFFLI